VYGRCKGVGRLAVLRSRVTCGGPAELPPPARTGVPSTLGGLVSTHFEINGCLEQRSLDAEEIIGKPEGPRW
jgi:hypothetical protein